MPAPSNLNIIPEDTTVTDLGITDGCEVMFLLAGTNFRQFIPRRESNKTTHFFGRAFSTGAPALVTEGT